MLMKEFHDNFWWPDCESRLRECTLAGYRGAYKNAIGPKWGFWDMGDIGVNDVNEWLANDFKNAGAAGCAWSTMRVILRAAIKCEVLERDITKKVKVPGSGSKHMKKQQPVLDKEQIGVLLKGLEGSEIEPFVICAVTLGLRKEEGCALEWSDINLKTGEVSINKGAQWIGGREVINPPKTKNSYRVLFLPEFALQRMREIHAEKVDEGTLHPRITGELTPNQVTNFYQKEIRDRNLPYVPPKNLRHSWATCTLREGVPISTVSKCLGHYDVSVTANHYIISSEKDFRMAQEAFQKAVAPEAVTSVSAEDIGKMTFMQRMRFLFRGEV